MRLAGIVRRLAVLFGVFLATHAALADVPRQITYQGRLTGGGTGPVDLTVRFYDTGTSGSPLFEETHVGVPRANGLFTLYIGSNTPGGVSDSALATGTSELWLGVSVNEQAELTPRTQIVMVPFAAKARAAEQLVVPSSFTPAVTVTPAGMVGIGTANPGYALDVSGGIRASETILGRAAVAEIPDHFVTTAPRWLRFAASPLDGGDNAGEFEISWRCSGVRGHLRLAAGIHYGEEPIELNLLGAARDGPPGITSVRLLKSSTYDPAFLELYVAHGVSGNGLGLTIRQLSGFGWNLSDPIEGSVPEGYSIHTLSTFNAFAINADPKTFTVTNDGNVGIGTSTPYDRLQVNDGLFRINNYTKPDMGDPRRDDYQIAFSARATYYETYIGQPPGPGLEKNAFVVAVDDGGGPVPSLCMHHNGNLGLGETNPTYAALCIRRSAAFTSFSGADAGAVGGGSFRIDHQRYGTEAYTRISQGNDPTDQFVLRASGNVGIGTATPQAKLDVAGTIRAGVVDILGGSDIAEPFDVAESESIKPGMVVCIDPDRPGKLRLSRTAHDRTVAGAVSGANGVNPGLTLKQQGTAADGALPVALTGRVYVWCDADAGGPIQPGDLLTTSDTPGHAMKVTDHAKAQGAILGKAMSRLESGEGLVLVLVSLQ